MSDLMHERKESTGEVVREVAQSDAYVAMSNHRAERMLYDIETSRLHVESKGGRDCLHERALAVDRKFAREQKTWRILRFVAQRCDERNKLRLEMREQSRSANGGYAGLGTT